MSNEFTPLFLSGDSGNYSPLYSALSLNVNEEDIVYFTTVEDSGDGSLRETLRTTSAGTTIAPSPDLFYDGEVTIYLESPFGTQWHGRNVIAGQKGKIHLIGDGTFNLAPQYSTQYRARGIYEDIIFDNFLAPSNTGFLGGASLFTDDWRVSRCMFIDCGGDIIRNNGTFTLNFESCVFVGITKPKLFVCVYNAVQGGRANFIGCTANDNVGFGARYRGTCVLTDCVCSSYYDISTAKTTGYQVADVCVDADNLDFRIKKDSPLAKGATVAKTGYDFKAIPAGGTLGAIGERDGNYMDTVFGSNAELALYAMGIATPEGTNVSAFN